MRTENPRPAKKIKETSQKNNNIYIYISQAKLVSLADESEMFRCVHLLTRIRRAKTQPRYLYSMARIQGQIYRHYLITSRRSFGAKLGDKGKPDLS